MAEQLPHLYSRGVPDGGCCRSEWHFGHSATLQRPVSIAVTTVLTIVEKLWKAALLLQSDQDRSRLLHCTARQQPIAKQTGSHKDRGGKKKEKRRKTSTHSGASNSLHLSETWKRKKYPQNKQTTAKYTQTHVLPGIRRPSGLWNRDTLLLLLLLINSAQILQNKLVEDDQEISIVASISQAMNF